jgi:hypothetical protein
VGLGTGLPSGNLEPLATVIRNHLLPAADGVGTRRTDMSENEEQPKGEQPEATTNALETPPILEGEETAEVLLPLQSEQQQAPPVQPSPSIQPPPATKKRGGRFRAILGVSLIFFGVLMLGDNLGWFRWFSWSDWWPVILIIIGLMMIFRRSRS